uniref:Uncharacterized protein n=1 Tax=Rhizophora mucronata TaxID=61149 RepID=A0A2P2QIT8_RHIMU
MNKIKYLLPQQKVSLNQENNKVHNPIGN